MKRDSKKIIKSAIEVDSGEKEIITVLKSLNNYEIGFEVAFLEKKHWLREQYVYSVCVQVFELSISCED